MTSKKTLKASLKVSAAAAVLVSFLLSGCATPTSTAKADSTKGRYIYLPAETGSRLPRRVWVDGDGRVADPGSSVQRVSPDALGDMQRKGSATRGGGQ